MIKGKTHTYKVPVQEKDNPPVLLTKEDVTDYKEQQREVDYLNGVVEKGVYKPLLLTNGGRYARDRRVANSHYSDDKKLEVVATYLALGNHIADTVRKTGVPRDTLKYWIKSEWWPKMVQQVYNMDRQKKSSRVSRIVTQALDQLEDRLENGDYIFDQRLGEIRRMPMSSKNVITAATQLMDRQITLEKGIEDTQEKMDVSVHLKNLADQFKKFNKGYKEPEIIDVEPINPNKPL